ncbi:hypothetical protein HK101_004367 [Irineochytrium annulatum]|nr:hypothetical protein HK101_004367 [Irineochytrium annulatum]
MKLSADVLRVVLDHLCVGDREDEALIMKTLFNCLLSSRLLFDVTVPFLWRRFVVSISSGTGLIETFREDSDRLVLEDTAQEVPVAEWLRDLENSLGNGAAATPEVARIASYLRSTPTIVLTLTDGNEPWINPDVVCRWIGVRHLRIQMRWRAEDDSWDQHWDRDWLRWLTGLGRDDTPSSASDGKLWKLTINEVPLGEDEEADEALTNVINLASVRDLHVTIDAPGGYLADFLRRRINPLDRLAPDPRGLALGLLRTSTAVARYPPSLTTPAVDGLASSAEADIAIVLASGSTLRDLRVTLPGGSDWARRAEFTDSLRNLRRLHLKLPGDHDQTDLDCILPRLVDLVDLEVHTRMKTGRPCSPDAALLAMPKLERLTLKGCFALRLTTGMVARLRKLALASGVVTVDDPRALTEHGMPKMVWLQLDDVRFVTRTGRPYEQLEALAADPRKTPRLRREECYFSK